MAIKQQTFKWKQQLLLLYYGMTDSRTPFYVKVPALASLLYLISPVDFIPDFIPFAGYLDDLIIVPLLLKISIKLLPEQVRTASQVKAKQKHRKPIIVFTIAMIGMLFLIAALFIKLKNIFWTF